PGWRRWSARAGCRVASPGGGPRSDAQFAEHVQQRVVGRRVAHGDAQPAGSETWEGVAAPDGVATLPEQRPDAEGIGHAEAEEGRTRLGHDVEAACAQFR